MMFAPVSEGKVMTDGSLCDDVEAASDTREYGKTYISSACSSQATNLKSRKSSSETPSTCLNDDKAGLSNCFRLNSGTACYCLDEEKGEENEVVGIPQDDGAFATALDDNLSDTARHDPTDIPQTISKSGFHELCFLMSLVASQLLCVGDIS